MTQLSHLYELSWDLTPYGAARLIRFPGCGDAVAWSMTRPVQVPKPVYFTADLVDVEKRCPDYPENNQIWPIMSARMCDVLLSLAPVAHRRLDVVLVDEDELHDDLVRAGHRLRQGAFVDDEREELLPRIVYDAGWQPRDGTFRSDYVALQLLEHVDAIDWDRSEYEPDDEEALDMPWSLEKLVLKEPQGGFPPLFRLAGSSGYLFVTDAARDSLQRAGIRGPGYVPLERVMPGMVQVPPEHRHRWQAGSGSR